MARGNGTATTTRTTTTTSPARKPAAANGTPAAARIRPIPAKVLKQAAVLGEPGRFAVLMFIAKASGAVTLGDVAEHRGPQLDASLILDHLKRRGWVVAERIPAGGGGPGWRYRLSDAGRERLMALGG